MSVEIAPSPSGDDERWRGRTVLALVDLYSVHSDPENWFMSQASDPFNFDYLPFVPPPLPESDEPTIVGGE